MKSHYLVTAACLMLSISPAFAGPREDTLAGISRCARLPDDRSFLDCIYGAAQPMRAELGLAPAPAFQTRLVPTSSAAPPMKNAATAPVPGNHGGLLSSLFGDSLRMTAYSFDPHGRFTVTLSDGQIWRQLASDQNFAHWRGPAADYYVDVQSSGTNNTLSVKGDDGGYQIERVR